MQQYIDQLKLEDESTDSIFGRDLLEAFKLSNHFYENRAIPSICYRCLEYLVKTGAIYEEGIFRLSGSASTIRQLKDQFNTQFDLDLFESNLKPDIHTVSGLLKTYLRELPSPIVGQHCYQHLNNVILHNNLSAASIATIFRDYFNDPANVDVVHYNTCYTIFKLLTQIIENSQSNRMNLRNVCIVFVPTLNISLEVLTIFLVDFSCIFENGSPVPDHKREVLDLHIPNF
jgi:RalA-binding protein 1